MKQYEIWRSNEPSSVESARGPGIGQCFCRAVHADLDVFGTAFVLQNAVGENEPDVYADPSEN